MIHSFFNIKYFNYIFIAIISLFVLIMPITVIGETGAQFTVTAYSGEGDTANQAQYFSISGEPGEVKTISVDIQNLDTSKAQLFTVELIQAGTSDSGKIVYSPMNRKPLDVTELQLKDLVDSDLSKQSIEIEAGQSQRISYEITIPAEGIQGTILGSIYVKKDSDNDQDSEGVTIKNEFAMSVPVMVQQKDSEKETPTLSLSEANVSSQAGTPKVYAQITNLSPVMFGEITLEAWVTEKNSDERLYENVFKDYEMAPYSYFNHYIDTQGKVLLPGEYTYHAILKSGDKQFDLTTDFNITEEQREEVNKQLLVPDTTTTFNIWPFVVGAILLAIIVGVIAYKWGKNQN